MMNKRVHLEFLFLLKCWLNLRVKLASLCNDIMRSGLMWFFPIINSVIYVLLFYFLRIYLCTFTQCQSLWISQKNSRSKKKFGWPFQVVHPIFFQSRSYTDLKLHVHILHVHFMYIINNVHVLPTCAHLPYEEIEMNFSISTPFDRKPTVKKPN